MYQEPILIAEDHPETAQILKRHLETRGYQVSLAGDGKEALQSFQSQEFPLLITDLQMPAMDGHDLIRAVQELQNPPVIIVLTVETGLDTVVKTMKLGVYDYVPKPVNIEDLTIKVGRALEAAQLRRMQRSVEEERRIRLERQLEWVNWKQTVSTRHADRQDVQLFNNLRTNLTQGYGFGALLTLLDMLSREARAADDGDYSIPRDMMDLIFDNAKVARRALETFTEIDDILNGAFERELLSIREIHALLERCVAELEELAALKDQSVQLSAPPPGAEDGALIHREYLESVFRELLVNAFKFSASGHSVLVLLKKDRDRLLISFMNRPIEGPDGIAGVPAGYENLVFEPFFRIERSVDERYQSLDYGLGLTRVQKIIQRHEGEIGVYNVVDHATVLQSAPGVRVNAEIALPLAPAG